MIRRFNLLLLFAALCVLSVSSAVYAQGFPYPSNQPGTATYCTLCPGTLTGQPTYPWGDPIVNYTGRWLDSSFTGDYQQTFRTGRASYAMVTPGRTRVYTAIGSALGAFDISTFFTRLENREPMMSVTSVPVSPGVSATRPPSANFEQFLKWDRFFYAENTGSGWKTVLIDGQDRLSGIDADDRGYAYLAYSIFGWGIVKDDGGTGGSLMTTMVQHFPVKGEITSPTFVMPLKNSAGDYFAVVQGGGAGGQEMWKVTDPKNPVRITDAPVGYLRAAHSLDRVGMILSDNTVRIYTSDALTSGGGPLVTFAMPPGAGAMRSITTDGTNFYAVAHTYAGKPILIAYLANATKTAYTEVDYRTNPGDQLSPQVLRYGDGYLALIANDNTAYGTDVLLYRVNGGQFTNIPMNSYAMKYYSVPPTGYVSAPQANISDALPVKYNNKLYLIISAYKLGDVYQIRSDDDVTVVLQGTSSTLNANAPAKPAGTVYYGDRARFVANTSGTAKTVNFNFGNPEAAPGADNNSLPGVMTGTPADHQYSGLSATSLAGTRNVTATDTASGTVGSFPLTLTAPVSRIGVTGASGQYKYLFAQANASSPAPIVVGDSFFDASDGDIQGHYAEWNLDGTVTKRVPYSALAGDYLQPVGDCGMHELLYAGHYGPYDPTFATLGSVDYRTTLVPVSGYAGFKYNVQPLAAGIDPTRQTSGSNLVFSSVSRGSAGVTAVSYTWDVVDSTGTAITSVPAQSGTAAITAIPQFSVPKSTFGAGPLQVRLRLTTTATFTGACAGITGSTALSTALRGPDPRIVDGGCPNGGPSCSYSVASLSGTDMAADHWHYFWYVNGSPSGTDSATFTPTFQSVGSYSITVNVSNDIGQASAGPVTASITAVPPACPIPTSGSVYIGYGAASGCNSSNGKSCLPGETVSFNPQSFGGFDSACASYTYTWDFGDGASGTGSNATHTYGGAGSFNVKLTIGNGTSSTYTATQGISIASGYTPPPPPGGSGSCGTMTTSNISLGMSPNCTSSSPCAANTGINFVAGGFGYDFTCGTHNFSWNFGDSQLANGQNLMHTYASGGTYNVTLTITRTSTPTQTFSTSAQVVIAGGSNPGTGSCPIPGAGGVYIAYGVGGCTSSNGQPCPVGTAIPFNVQANFGTSFDASCSSYTYAWNFGDNTSGTGAAPSHAYASNGTYNVSLTIGNGSGNTFQTTAQVVVGTGGTPGGSGSCPIPTANSVYVAYGAGSGCNSSNGLPCQSGEAVTFNPQSFGGFDATCSAYTFNWDFGDGVTKSGANAVHVFAAPATYSVKLTIGNGTTSTYVTTQQITIGPPGSGGTPSVVFDFTIAPLTAGTVAIPNGYTFTATTTTGTVAQWTWDFGDGNTTTGGATQTHIYADSKEYTVTLTAKGASGQTLGVQTHKLSIASRRRPSRH